MRSDCQSGGRLAIGLLQVEPGRWKRLLVSLAGLLRVYERDRGEADADNHKARERDKHADADAGRNGG